MDQKAIGKKIRDLRTKMGLTTVTLAKKAKLSQAQVSRLENGVQGFLAGTLQRLAKTLGVPPIYFFVEDEDTHTAKLAEELEARGLEPSAALRKALANVAFLRFVEKCAAAFKASKKDLEKMRRAVMPFTDPAPRRPRGRPRKQRRKEV